MRPVLHIVWESEVCKPYPFTLCGVSYPDDESELKKKCKVQKKYGLRGLRRLASLGLKDQTILVSDELLCKRCRSFDSAKEAAQIIISLSKSNKVMLMFDDAQVIPLRSLLRKTGIRYTNGVLIPKEDRWR